MIAQRLEIMAKENPYSKLALTLQKSQNYLPVVLEPPCHGEDIKPNESSELSCWRYRADHLQNFAVPFTQYASKVLTWLIHNNDVDESDVVISGTSRGGFISFYWAVFDKRIKLIAAFSPVTDLTQLDEFKGSILRLFGRMGSI